MEELYVNPIYKNFIRVLNPDTIPKSIQDNRMLMVYDEEERVVGAFFSLGECSEYFKISVQVLKKTMKRKGKLYGSYTPIWVRTKSGKQNTYSYNKGEIVCD